MVIKKVIFKIFGGKKKHVFTAASLLLLSVLILFIYNSTFDIENEYHGIFVLKSEKGFGVDIRNDLYPDEVERLLVKFDFQLHYERFFIKINKKAEEKFLSYVWDVRQGRGFVKSYLDGDKEMLFCFSRYKEETGKVTKGLFLGGNLPPSDTGDDAAGRNDTGMAFFDGKRWYHIWCTTNQGLASGSNPAIKVHPSEWIFLNTKVLKNGDDELILKSSHKAYIGMTPLRIDRYAWFKAGLRYFVLVNTIQNVGREKVSYYYVYGDEPWVGDFGRSTGNVGWANGGLIKYEQYIDTKKHSYAGFFDYGNDLTGEGHNFTGVANFIEWLGPYRPETAYFSNQEGKISPERKMPLSSDTGRFFGLQWGPRVLAPGQLDTFAIAMGMADNDPVTGFPVKPAVNFDISRFMMR